MFHSYCRPLKSVFLCFPRLFSLSQPVIFSSLSELWYSFLLLILSYYVSFSSSLTDHPSVQVTSIQRHQRNTGRNRKKQWERQIEKSRWQVLRFQLYWLKELEGVTLHHFLTGKTVWQNGSLHTHTHRYSNVDRKTACCQDKVSIYCFPSISVHAPKGTDKHAHTLTQALFCTLFCGCLCLHGNQPQQLYSKAAVGVRD